MVDAPEQVWSAAVTVNQPDGRVRLCLAMGQTESEALGRIMQSLNEGDAIAGRLTMAAYREADGVPTTATEASPPHTREGTE